MADLAVGHFAISRVFRQKVHHCGLDSHGGSLAGLASLEHVVEAAEVHPARRHGVEDHDQVHARSPHRGVRHRLRGQPAIYICFAGHFSVSASIKVVDLVLNGKKSIGNASANLLIFSERQLDEASKRITIVEAITTMSEVRS